MPTSVTPVQESVDGPQNAARESLRSLDSRRKALEAEASAIVDELMAVPDEGGNPMGVDTPLTDGDGYPRNDIDVYRARVLRQRLNEIRTDHKAMMKQIETGLVKAAAFSRTSAEEKGKEREARVASKPKPKFDPITGKWVTMNWDGTVAGVEGGDQRNFGHLEAPPISASAPGATAAAVDAQEDEGNLVPFAVVDTVFPHSPASAAGLHEGDLIVKFGAATHLNHDDLKLLAQIVPEAAGNRKEIQIQILRRRTVNHAHDAAHNVEAGVREELTVDVLPGPWGGRGLLGCHIKGYSDTPDREEPS
eukprot:CAMPEP_0113596458 /NCGR_PEP_ID=MMETSP0015_2-20120614/40344_1 /TAXON_ID=2838 /ORGANISM="Odontella" /LENGTH=305 /DNA_ID=CAMNT_0000503969 /DNA_START=117 /DNA_END=1035 /DNA_ORIENTATION=+ /assembly_acc=CAM_ASM_000160